MASVPIPEDLAGALPRRHPQTHKGDVGRVLILGGSLGMHGAPVLAAAAALRSGAGLVTVAVPERLYPVAGPAELRATWLPYADDGSGRLTPAAVADLVSAVEACDVVALGPGLGRHPDTVQALHQLVPLIHRPLVVDADGLNAFAGRPGDLHGQRPATVLTPHPGEWARLTGRRVGGDDEERRVAAIDLAMRAGAVVLLKGHRTVVTDGLSSHRNESGNPGMATGGAGDVLTGCLAALLAVIPEPLRAARVAAWAHGCAGDRAAAQLTEIGVTATDLLPHLPHALQDFVAPAHAPGAPPASC